MDGRKDVKKFMDEELVHCEGCKTEGGFIYNKYGEWYRKKYKTAAPIGNVTLYRYLREKYITSPSGKPVYFFDVSCRVNDERGMVDENPANSVGGSIMRSGWENILPEAYSGRRVSRNIKDIISYNTRTNNKKGPLVVITVGSNLLQKAGIGFSDNVAIDRSSDGVVWQIRKAGESDGKRTRQLSPSSGKTKTCSRLRLPMVDPFPVVSAPIELVCDVDGSCIVFEAPKK